MGRAYRRLAHGAIVALCGLSAAGATAGEGLLCVLVPHLKDEYWLSVAQGIETRAAAVGLEVRFFEAGGYRALAGQNRQLADCGALPADAILLGAVSSDDPALLAAVAAAAAGRPVIGLVNELHSDALAARVGVDWFDMGLKLGRHLAGLHPAGTEPQRAVLLSGPPVSGWVAPLETGLRQGLEGSAVSIVAVYGADTGTTEQLRLLETALAAGPPPDLVIGAAPAIEAAMALLPGMEDPPGLAATYVSHSVARGLVGGRIIAAPYDDPMRQGELAVDAARAAIAGVTRREPIGPPIIVQTAGAAPGAFRLSPVGYFPAID